MNRRAFMTALTGCAVAKPVSVVMVPKRYAMANIWALKTMTVDEWGACLQRDHGLLDVADGVSLKMDRFEEPEFERILDSNAQAIVRRKPLE